jgi:urea transporter
LMPFAIPALTAPFVLVTWLFLLPRQCLQQVRAVTPDIEKPTAVA